MKEIFVSVSTHHHLNTTEKHQVAAWCVDLLAIVLLVSGEEDEDDHGLATRD